MSLLGFPPHPALATFVMAAIVEGGALTTCSPYCIAGPKLGLPTFFAIRMVCRKRLNLGSLFMTFLILLCTAVKK